jgi:hypothetical protein
MPKLLRGTGMSIRRIRQLAVMVEQGDTSLEAHIAFFSERGAAAGVSDGPVVAGARRLRAGSVEACLGAS